MGFEVDEQDFESDEEVKIRRKEREEIAKIN